MFELMTRWHMQQIEQEYRFRQVERRIRLRREMGADEAPWAGPRRLLARMVRPRARARAAAPARPSMRPVLAQRAAMSRMARDGKR